MTTFPWRARALLCTVAGAGLLCGLSGAGLAGPLVAAGRFHPAKARVKTVDDRPEGLQLLLDVYCQIAHEPAVASAIEAVRERTVSARHFRDAEEEHAFQRELAIGRVWLWRKARQQLSPEAAPRVERALGGVAPYGRDAAVVKGLSAACGPTDAARVLAELEAGLALERSGAVKGLPVPPLSRVTIDDQPVSIESFDRFVKGLKIVPGTQVSGESPNGQYTTYEALDPRGRRVRVTLDGEIRSASPARAPTAGPRRP